MRDPQKVAAEMSARNEIILERAFELFSANAIEDVSMNEVAQAAGIGIATLYRYYGTKQELVLAVSESRWSSFRTYINEIGLLEKTADYSDADRLGLFLDMIIYIYRERKDLLRFTANFDTYASHRNMSDEQLEKYRTFLAPTMEYFTTPGKETRTEDTVCSGFTQDEVFSSFAYPMLSTAIKFVNGMFWPYKKDLDGEKSLLALKKALMDFYTENMA